MVTFAEIEQNAVDLIPAVQIKFQWKLLVSLTHSTRRPTRDIPGA